MFFPLLQKVRTRAEDPHGLSTPALTSRLRSACEQAPDWVVVQRKQNANKQTKLVNRSKVPNKLGLGVKKKTTPGGVAFRKIVGGARPGFQNPYPI